MGGYLLGNKNVGKIFEVRGIEVGILVILFLIFKDLYSVVDFKKFVDRVCEVIGGILIGFKLSVNYIEEDI